MGAEKERDEFYLFIGVIVCAILVLVLLQTFDTARISRQLDRIEQQLGITQQEARDE